MNKFESLGIYLIKAEDKDGQIYVNGEVCVQKRILLVLLVAVMILMSGCTDKNSINDSGEKENTVGFRISDIEIPEGILQINNIVRGEDGLFYMSAINEDCVSGSVWKKGTGQDIWEKEYDYEPFFPDEVRTGEYELYSYISPKGDLYGEAFHIKDKTRRIFRIKNNVSEEISFQIDASGIEQGTDNSIMDYRFSPDGILVVGDEKGQLYIVEEDNPQKTKEVLDMKEDGYYWDYYVSAENIYVLTEQSIDMYSLATGEKIDNQELENFSEQFCEMEAMAPESYASQRIIVDDSGEHLHIILENKKGVFEYDNGILSRQMGAAGTNFIKAGHLITGMEWDGKDSFVEVLDSVQDGAQLLKFTKINESYHISEKLSVFTLRENEELQELTKEFVAANPEVEIDIEVGLTEENGITASDAIRKLNTKILAGDGPDVILMDGLNVNDYIEKQILLEVTDTYEEIKNENVLFDTVVETYREGDAVYAIPGRFELMYETQKNDAGSYPAMYSAEMAAILYRTNLMKNQAVEKEAIAEYYKSLEELYKQCTHDMTEQDMYKLLENQQLLSEDLQEELALYSLDASRIYGYLNGVQDYQFLKNGSEGELSYRLLSQDNKNMYVPIMVFGVVKTTPHKDASLTFLRYVLSLDGQKNFGGRGFSVNKMITEDDLQGVKENTVSNDVSIIDFSGFTDEQIEDILKELESAQLAANTDEVVFEIVKNQAVSYLSGSLSLDEAASQAERKIRLYQAE